MGNYFMIQRFPRRPLLQKETPDECLKNFPLELFNGSEDPKFYISKRKPALITKNLDDTLDRGKGIRQFHYRAITISGFPTLPNPL